MVQSATLSHRLTLEQRAEVTPTQIMGSGISPKEDQDVAVKEKGREHQVEGGEAGSS